ncbi:TetR family transcriptional regulator C-terminal domain-containing protein [Acinetobacter sp. B10A]|uniref:TetR/AcrR family transcriptional regulator n=1 Tax=Acinetobacter baretiae TaxID=2605383 RepID=UPI001B3C9DC0|nr:TetR/AcrR family transcriptional regulator [Acinetobacter baretiae]MBF7685762.1 TetR family transcriptional regulator C-terminal domain-containing protein [Acinetobacter baretiae]
MELKKSTQKRHQLLNAALDVFCLYGFTGASLDDIAKRSDMHKSNIFYYFSNKEALYIEVLTSVLQKWLESMQMLNVDEDPEEMLTKYIESKLEFSRLNPKASKLFALEIIQGAPYIQTILKGSIKKHFRRKVKVIAQWQTQGKIAADISPELFIMNLWSITQSYADFETQFEVLIGKTLRNRSFYQTAMKNNLQLLLHGALVK